MTNIHFDGDAPGFLGIDPGTKTIYYHILTPTAGFKRQRQTLVHKTTLKRRKRQNYNNLSHRLKVLYKTNRKSKQRIAGEVLQLIKEVADETKTGLSQ